MGQAALQPWLGSDLLPPWLNYYKTDAMRELIGRGQRLEQVSNTLLCKWAAHCGSCKPQPRVSIVHVAGTPAQKHLTVEEQVRVALFSRTAQQGRVWAPFVGFQRAAADAD